MEKRWPEFLRWNGNRVLWEQVADDELREHWLVGDTDLSHPDLSPQSALIMGAMETHVDLESIRYCVAFVAGDKLTIVYLSNIDPAELTAEEIKFTPGFEEREEKKRREEMKIATKAEKITEKKIKLVIAQEELEATRRQRQKEDARLARQRAQQSVNRQKVREALHVKTDRGVWKICRRHQVEWPNKQGELDRLVLKHERHKKTVRESLGRRNKARARSDAVAPM